MPVAITHSPTVGTNRPKMVNELACGEWCIDTHGDYWTRGTQNGPMTCFFKAGGSTTDIRGEDFTVKEMIPKGTEIKIIVGLT